VSISEPLRTVLWKYCDVNAIELSSRISERLDAITLSAFQAQLAAAIHSSSISPEEYETLTNASYDTQEELDDWLRSLYEVVFGERL